MSSLKLTRGVQSIASKGKEMTLNEYCGEKQDRKHSRKTHIQKYPESVPYETASMKPYAVGSSRIVVKAALASHKKVVT